MVRKLVLGSLFLVACTDSGTDPGGPCKADLSCADGLVCNFQAAAPICLAADADEDGDGLVNTQDFCPATPGGSNHDEDGDKQGDSCDLCPIEAWRQGTKDGDGDGLAGLCDPLDVEKGDKVVFFETFENADALSKWKLDDATHFSIADDTLKVTVTAADPGADAIFSLPRSPVSAAVFVSYRVVDAAPAGVDNASRDIVASIFDPSPMANGGRARCGANSETGQAGVLRLLTDKGEQSQPFSESFVVGDVYRLLLQTERASSRCVQIRGQTSASVENPVEPGQKGAVSLSVRSVAANYNYIFVVESPIDR
jgi:hypothetical protein